MLFDGPHRLDGTWRTWIRGDGVFFNFITEQKRDDWTPEYFKLMGNGWCGGNAIKKRYPEVRNSRNGVKPG